MVVSVGDCDGVRDLLAVTDCVCVSLAVSEGLWLLVLLVVGDVDGVALCVGVGLGDGAAEADWLGEPDTLWVGDMLCEGDADADDVPDSEGDRLWLGDVLSD